MHTGENGYHDPVTDPFPFSVILGWVTLLMVTQFPISCFVLQKKWDVFHWALYELLERQYFLKKIPLCLLLCAQISKALIQSAEINKSLSLHLQ